MLDSSAAVASGASSTPDTGFGAIWEEIMRHLLKDIETTSGSTSEKAFGDSLEDLARQSVAKAIAEAGDAKAMDLTAIDMGEEEGEDKFLGALIAAVVPTVVSSVVRLVRRIERSDGTLLWSAPPVREAVMDPRDAFQVTSMLRSVVDEGTGTAIRAMGITGGRAVAVGNTAMMAEMGIDPAVLVPRAAALAGMLGHGMTGAVDHPMKAPIPRSSRNKGGLISNRPIRGGS